MVLHAHENAHPSQILHGIGVISIRLFHPWWTNVSSYHSCPPGRPLIIKKEPITISIQPDALLYGFPFYCKTLCCVDSDYSQELTLESKGLLFLPRALRLARLLFQYFLFLQYRLAASKTSGLGQPTPAFPK